MSLIVSLLEKFGPSRSSRIASELQKLEGITAEASRQRIARSNNNKVLRFPYPLLPNRESFLYLDYHRAEERFWINFLQALRETNSVYGFAIDALIAKGGIISISEFPVISGAPLALKGQVSSERLLSNLIGADVFRKQVVENVECVVLNRYELGNTDFTGYRPKQMIEKVILETSKDWARKLGLASYNSIKIRPDEVSNRKVGAFVWDLTGPSYLLPLRGNEAKPGFLVGDVFSGGTLDEHQINYIIRKAQLFKASVASIKILPLLIADAFTGTALTKGRKEGILLATPEMLFGYHAARGLKNLLDTLMNAAAIVSAKPDKLLTLIDQLKDIEGSAGNLRGILFELISAYIAKIQGGSIEFGITARDKDLGRTADIDVFRIVNKGECVVIECKGKMPGGIVSPEEISDWLDRIPIFISHLRDDKRFSDSKISFEIWTSGNFHPDALEILEHQKTKRIKHPIDWLNGTQVFNISKNAKEKRINDALKEHFLKHPLAQSQK